MAPKWKPRSASACPRTPEEFETLVAQVPSQIEIQWGRDQGFQRPLQMTPVSQTGSRSLPHNSMVALDHLGKSWRDPGNFPLACCSCLWEDKDVTAGSLNTQLQEILLCTSVGGDRMPTPKLLNDLRAKNHLLRRWQPLVSGCCSQVR